jgi:hypothetical protein
LPVFASRFARSRLQAWQPKAAQQRVKSSRGQTNQGVANIRTKISVLAFILALAFMGQSHADEIDWSKVDTALGKTAAVQGDVHRYGIPRTDLQVTLDGVAIKPALALGGWLAFEPMQDGAVVMGDLVLTEPEVNPVMSKLLESGIEITAVHNHLIRGSPATLYMHIHGHGDPVVLATSIRTALSESKTPFTAPAAPSTQTAQIDIDTDKLDAAIGVKGKVNGGVYQFSVPRKDPITEDGVPVPPAMGTAIAINFQPTGGGKAAATSWSRPQRPIQ